MTPVSRRCPLRHRFTPVLALLVLGGCEDEVVAPGGGQVDRVELNPPSLALEVDGLARLDVAVRNQEGFLLAAVAPVWSSSRPDVATVDSLGVIRALREGTTEVSAEVAGVHGSADVRVVAAPAGVWREHACAVDVNGAAWCWGRGVNGELGQGERGGSAVPLRVALDDPWAQVSAGAGHTCGIVTTGEAHCWGRGSEGQLGHGGTESRSAPAAVDDGVYRTVSAGGRHTCGIRTSGEVRCWGEGEHGQLGNGAATNVATPIDVQGAPPLRSISAGGLHTCALTPAGEAFCWGANVHGQLGDGTTTRRATATPVATGLRFKAISAGARHTCAVDLDGGGWCWGDNREGQHGSGTLDDALHPQPVRSVPDFRLASVSAGAVHTCGVHVNGVAHCWGANGHGQLGDGTTVRSGNPTAVGTALFRAVTAGAGHTCGVSEGGTVLCWGFGGFGQLGDGGFGSRPIPAPLIGELRFPGPR